MTFYKSHSHVTPRQSGFTMVETVIAISLVGIGIAASVVALTQINNVASTSRNATGAYTVVQNQIDAILSNGPFNPQKTDPATGLPLIPPELKSSTKTDVPVYAEPVKTAWTYPDAAARTGATGFASSDIGGLAFQTDTGKYWRLTSASPTTWATDPGGVVVLGTLTTTIRDASATYNGRSLVLYNARVTITYTYRNRSYSFSMDTVRSSDI